MDTIPGADTLGFGFNIIKRYHESSTTQQIFKEGTPDARTMTIGTTTYAVPQNIATEPIQATDGESHVFSTRQQVQDHFAGKASISGSGFGFKGQFETSYSHVTNTDKSYYYALVEATGAGYNLKLKQQGTNWLTPQFAAALNALPSSFTEANKQEFFAFFGKYGTHYVHQVQLGGSLYYYVAIEKSSSADESNLRMNLDAEYKGLFGKVKSHAEAEWQKVDRNWATNRIVRLRTQGGDNFLDGIAPGYKEWKGDSFAEWSRSLINKPGLAGFNLAPISSLVPSEQFAKADAMQRAIVDYLRGGIVVRADREFSLASARPRFVGYSTIEGPEGPVRPNPAPPASDNELCGMQISLFDPDTLKTIFNRNYYGVINTVPNMYADAIRDVNAVGQRDYYAAVSIYGVSPVQVPTAELAAWIQRCGGRLENWNKYIRATTIAGGTICYTLAGRVRSSRAQETFAIDPSRNVDKLNSTSLLFMRGQGLQRAGAETEPEAEAEVAEVEAAVEAES